MGTHEDLYSAHALDLHMLYFGDSVTFTPVGGSGSSVTAQVLDLPDDVRFIGRRFRVRVSQVALADGVPGAKVTDSDGTWRVAFASIAHGGSYDLDCELLQLNG